MTPALRQFLYDNQNVELDSLNAVPAHEVILIHIPVEHLQDKLLPRQVGQNHLVVENKAFKKCPSA